MIAVLLCSCAMSDAVSFDFKSVDNGQNNYLAGGSIAFKDNTLYVSVVSDLSETSKLFAVNNKDVKLINETGDVSSYTAGARSFYQTADKLYVNVNGWQELNTGDNSFKKADKDIVDTINEVDYCAGGLVVKSVDYGKKVKVTYKGKTYALELDYQDLCVDGDKVYFINSWDEIRRFNPNKGKSECKHLTDTLIDHNLFFRACGGCVYYDAVGDPDNQEAKDSGLYCYNEKTKKHTLAIQGEINSLNCYEDTLYAAAGSGIYKCSKDNAVKLCGEKADEIYIMDNNWIYGLNKSDETVFRVAKDGSKTESVSLKIK